MNIGFEKSTKGKSNTTFRNSGLRAIDLKTLTNAKVKLNTKSIVLGIKLQFITKVKLYVLVLYQSTCLIKNYVFVILGHALSTQQHRPFQNQ